MPQNTHVLARLSVLARNIFRKEAAATLTARPSYLLPQNQNWQANLYYPRAWEQPTCAQQYRANEMGPTLNYSQFSTASSKSSLLNQDLFQQEQMQEFLTHFKLLLAFDCSYKATISRKNDNIIISLFAMHPGNTRVYNVYFSEYGRLHAQVGSALIPISENFTQIHPRFWNELAAKIKECLEPY